MTECASSPILRLSVAQLSKSYSTRFGARQALKSLVNAQSNADQNPLVVDDVSFNLYSGQAMAIIGLNGSGKSTLLKMLGGLLKPSAGQVTRHGSIESVIELGAGIYNELTGRENIKLRAALKSIKGKNLQPFVDKVIDFSELGAGIDKPVRTYSSGMRARLAFAIATGFAPDILLIDEALAVGDHNFQNKCLRHLDEYVHGGGALILVSHAMMHIQAICHQGIVLDEGRMVFAGTADEAINQSLTLLSTPSLPNPQQKMVNYENHASNSAGVSITSVSVSGLNGAAIETGKPIAIDLILECAEALEIGWGFNFLTDNAAVYLTGAVKPKNVMVPKGRSSLQAIIPHCPLLAGHYLMNICLIDPHLKTIISGSERYDPPILLKVITPLSEEWNLLSGRGQKMILDVEW